MKLQPGGSEGGEIKFLVGLLMSVAGLWFFFDSVNVTSGHPGLISGALRGNRGGGLWQTTSMGIVLVPLFVGIVALFFDARRTWAWVLTLIGIAILVVEIVSRFRPEVRMKVSHGILMLVLIAGGIGLMLRAYVEIRKGGQKRSDPEGKDSSSG